MTALFSFVWMVLLNAGPVDAYLQHYFQNPQKHRASLDQALTLLQQQNDRKTFFEVVDSAAQLTPDPRLFQRATLFAARIGDTARVRQYGTQWILHTASPVEARGVYSQIFFRGYQEVADQVLQAAIQRWGEEPFLREQYQKALWARDYERALDVLLRELKVKKDVAYVLSEVRRLKKYLGASAFQDALKRAGEFREAHIVRAWLAFDAGDWEQAIQEALKSKDPTLMLDLADRLVQDRQMDRAERLLKVIPKENQTETYFLLRARIARARGQWRKSLEFYEKAGPSAHPELLETLLEHHQYEEVLRRATQPGDLRYRVQALLALNRLEEAKQLVSAQPDPYSQYLNALLELVDGNPARADTLFRNFVNGFPRSAEADQALFHLEILRTFGSSKAFALYQSVQRALLTQRPDSAFPWIEAFQPETPHDQSLRLYLLGLLSERVNRVDQALGYYRELGAQDTVFLGAYALYRAAKLEMEAVRDTQAALETLKLLIRRFPQSPYAAIARTYF